MIAFNDVRLNQLIIHQVGNKQKGKSVRFSENTVNTDELIKELLIKYFFSAFKTEAYFSLFHESDLDLNDVYTYISKIFADKNQFILQSKNLAKHLYDQSTHPKIKDGEFYVVLFENIQHEDELVDAIGLFKSENKETYLRVYPNENNYQVQSDNGINISKVDKGCLIFNTERDAGYKVMIVDNLNKSFEAQYWKDDFLKLQQRQDSYYQTQAYMDVCKTFVKDVYNSDNQVERADQITMLNDSINYFNSHKEFDMQDFEKEVMQNDEIVQAFNDHKNSYEEKQEIKLQKDFGISDSAVKKGKAQFKSILKLDKNFHVYIHGNRDRIQKGYDQSKSMHFYQIFFDQEI